MAQKVCETYLGGYMAGGVCETPPVFLVLLDCLRKHKLLYVDMASRALKLENRASRERSIELVPNQCVPKNL